MSDPSAKSKTPAIRFKGFSGEWVEKRAIELCSISTGKNNTQDKIHEGKYPFYVRSPIIERSNNYLFDEEAVLTVGDGVGTGKVYHYVNGKYDLHQRVYRMYDFNGVTGKYFFYFFSNNFYIRVISMTAKTSVDSVRMEMIADMMIKAPEIQEQISIANFFQQLDRLIAQHQQKLDKLQSVKKALLEKMFPKQGETQPAIRFKGFSEPWEEKALGDVGTVAMNKRIFKDQTSNIGDIPFFKIGTFGGMPDSFISEELFKEYKEKYPFPSKGDLLISASGSIGRIVEYDGKDQYFQDSNIVWLKHDGKIENSFLKVFYSIVKWSGLEGSTIQRLYNKSILETPIKLPKPKEQTKIGKFFQQLDSLINQQQSQLTKLANIKQAMLAKMFV